MARLNAHFVAVMSGDDVKKELAQLGLTVRTSMAAQFAALIKSDLVRWRKVVTDAAITAD